MHSVTKWDAPEKGKTEPPKVAPIQIYLGKEEVKKVVMKMPRSE